ncbi:TolC family protein [Gracilimonas sp.]|uniref:TolC family protein n=1 Tax=Gracilimonas sp. TaxID=1974203 RepID=UPI0028725A1F|nr:TolC family protein [Gracilimonas sp.]
MTARSLYIFLALIFSVNISAFAQDTLKIDVNTFMEVAKDNSGQMDYNQQNVELAENRIELAKAQRILPNLRFESQHGLVPGVKSNNPNLSENEYYLDPNLENDWEDWAVFTRFSITAAQPVFTWGAISKAIEAAKLGVEAAQYEFDAKQSDFEIRLFELYYSYVLALEVEQLLNEAQEKIIEVDKKIEKMREEGDTSLDESEIFKFEIYKSEFEIQKAEVFENLNFVRETWNYVLRNEEDIIYEPEIRFLDPIASEIEPIDFYQSAAFNNRPELKALDIGKEATETYMSSLKSQNLPGLYLGGYFNFANTPNRPRQSNPFIINNTNKLGGGFGLTIRQDLNFFSIRSSLERSRIELRKVTYAKDAAKDGIMLEVNDSYRKASLADVKVKQTDSALVTSKRWLRQEQLDYDFGMGEVKDLVDAMKKELELKLQLKQRIFEFNTSLAKLNKTAGIPLTTFITN